MRGRVRRREAYKWRAYIGIILRNQNKRIKRLPKSIKKFENKHGKLFMFRSYILLIT